MILDRVLTANCDRVSSAGIDKQVSLRGREASQVVHDESGVLRGAALSITNNIAEGSGSASDIDFANFLNMSRRSVFEVANILMLLSKDGYIARDEAQPLLKDLEEESRMILAFRRTLKS